MRGLKGRDMSGFIAEEQEGTVGGGGVRRGVGAVKEDARVGKAAESREGTGAKGAAWLRNGDE